MATCPVCAGAGAGPVSLILRVWPEDDEVRGRLIGVTGAASSVRPVVVVQGVEAICEAVRGWLRTI